MKREDLRVRINRGTNTIPVHFYDEVSDADLAALGYVKLDVDVEALRLLARGGWSAEASDVIRQVIAALDGEEA